MVIIAALIAVIIFGASPVAAKLAVASIAALDVALLRTVVGGLIAIALAVLLRIDLPRSPNQRRLLAISGFCGYIAFPVLFTFGVLLTSASHAAMILATLPIITGAIALVWDRKRPSRYWLLGSAIGFLGAALLAASAGDPASDASTAGDLIVLFANLFAASGYVAGGRLQQSGYPARAATFWGVAICALVLLLPALLLVDWNALWSSEPRSLLGLGYLAVGVTIVGYMLWYWALGSGGIARIGLIQFLQPVSGILLAAWLLGERVGGVFLLSAILILVGVWIAITSRE